MSSLTVDSEDQLKRSFLWSVFIVVSSAGVLLSWSQLRLYPTGLTPLIAAVALYLNDYRRWVRLPVLLANLLGLLALFQLFNQFEGTNLERLQSGTDLLVELTWIVLLMPNTGRRYWWLLGLAALQTAAGTVLISDAGFGVALFVLALLIQWAMCLMTMQSVIGRPRLTRALLKPVSTAVSRQRGRRLRLLLRFLGLDRRERLRDQDSDSEDQAVLIRHGVDLGTHRIVDGAVQRLMGVFWGISLLVAVVAFAVFPRMWMNTDALFAMTPGEALGIGAAGTGLTRTVRLGAYGRLLQSNQLALTLRVRNLRSDREVNIQQFLNAMRQDELYLRGNVYSHYKAGEWELHDRATRPLGPSLQPRAEPAADYELDIRLEPSAATIPVSLLPTRRFDVQKGPPLKQEQRSEILRWDADSSDADMPGVREYRIRTESLLSQTVSSGQRHPILDARDGPLRHWEVSNQLERVFFDSWISSDIQSNLPKLTGIIRRIVPFRANRGGRPEPMGLSTEEKVRLVLDYLSPENGFRYSLDQPRIDLDEDPIDAFLTTGKTGHCEYFASACTLLLQAMRVPCRLVTGYAGCETDSSTGEYAVYQRNAHTWVEVWMGDNWRVIDPTPYSDRLANRSGIRDRSLLQSMGAAFSGFWTGAVSDMSSDRQRAFLEPLFAAASTVWMRLREDGPISALIEARRYIRMGSLTGPIAGLFLIALGMAVWKGKLPGFGALRRLKRSESSGTTVSEPTAARRMTQAYLEFRLICADAGLPCPVAATALDNARAAEARLTELLLQAGLSGMPERLAQAYHRIRFGGAEPDEREFAEIHSDLHRFRKAAESARGGTQSSAATVG